MGSGGSAARVSEGCADCAIAVVEGAVDIEGDGELAVDFEGGVVNEDGGVGRVAVLAAEDDDSAFKVGAASAAERDDGVKPASSSTTSPSSEICVGSSPFALVNRPRRLTAPLSGADGSGSGSPACARGWASALRFPTAFRAG